MKQEIKKEINPSDEYDIRIQRLNKIRELGIDPYPAKARRDYYIKDVISNFEDLEKKLSKFFIVGRLRSNRSHGNLTFAQIQDDSGMIQIALSKKEIGDEKYKQFVNLVDVGDFLEIQGNCFTTHKGEKSVMVSDWKFLSKSLRSLPEKWHGFKDEEERLRKRYLDIICNPEIKDMFVKRSKFWNSMRKFLLDRGFLEVETPALEVTTGGADARPFVTHHNALDIDVFLRISTGELWQKQLMVAGYDKTFEIGRQFRNEGMDAEHLQDYTQMEFYWAYADYEMGMELVEEMYKYVASETFGTLKFKIKDFDIDLGKKWETND